MFIRPGTDTVSIEATNTVDGLVASAKGLSETVNIMTRGVRATLETKKLTCPNDLYAPKTNCVGSYLHLRNCLGRAAIDVQPLLVARYPWHQQDSCYDIHVVGTVRDKESGYSIITDATPLPGYTHGQTFVTPAAEKSTELTIYDDQLGSSTRYQRLSDGELDAITQAYVYEVGGDLKIPPDELLCMLDHIPAYKSRLLRALIEKTGEARYIAQFNRLPVEAIRRSYSQYLTDSEKIHRHDLYHNRETSYQTSIGARALSAAAESTSYGSYARWIALAIQLGVTISENTTAYPKSPLSFSAHSQTPIFDYEILVAHEKPSALSSNLYADEWER